MTDQAGLTSLDAMRREYDIGWQPRCVGMLTRLLDLSAERSLPVIAWTVTGGAPQLLARCEGYPQTRRRDDFQAWKTALTALVGPPDAANERALPGRGAVHAYAIWDRHKGVRINLAVEWDDLIGPGAAVPGRADR